jgi:4-amino-4-deoxy-L-arabinose transferase-like glycosyltransferase
MKKWVLLALFAVFFLAIFIRLYPLTKYAIWGSDSGEYYYISSQLASDGYISTDYDGWGFGYPYFPGMFYLIGAAHFLTDMDILWAMILTIPILASFSVLIVFFMAKSLFKSDGAGLLAGAVIAVSMPHVFATSHPMPGSVGDMLILSTILFFLFSFKSRKFILLSVMSALALTLTHHLSSYFLFIALFGGLFLSEMLKTKNRKETWFHWGFLISLLTVLILYWTIAAQSFADRVISSAFDLPYWLILSIGYGGLFLALIMIKLRIHFKWRYKPKFPQAQRQIALFIILLIILLSVLFFMAFVKVPGTDLELTPAVALLFTPLVVLLAFTSVGAGYLKFIRGGMMIYGWILALVLSLVMAMVTSNRVLLTYRHPQYLIAPLALAIGVGMVMLFNAFGRDKKGFRKGLILGLVVVLFGLTSISAYPSKELMGGFQEGTSQEDMQSVFWARESLNKGATVATDHRMSSMVFGFAGLNATWDEAYNTLHASSYEECRDEIENIEIPSGEKSIDYFLLDDDIKDGVALRQWVNAEPMSFEAQKKFEEQPFVKLYEANGVEVYGMAR